MNNKKNKKLYTYINCEYIFSLFKQNLIYPSLAVFLLKSLKNSEKNMI